MLQDSSITCTDVMQNQSFEKIVIDPCHFGHQKMRSFEPHRTNMELDLVNQCTIFFYSESTMYFLIAMFVYRATLRIGFAMLNVPKSR